MAIHTQDIKLRGSCSSNMRPHTCNISVVRGYVIKAVCGFVRIALAMPCGYFSFVRDSYHSYPQHKLRAHLLAYGIVVVVFSYTRKT